MTLQRSLLYMQHMAFLPPSPSKQGRRSKYWSRDSEERGTTSYLFSSPLDIGSQMMEVMSHSFLHSRQKHIFKYQALFCERVSNNWQYFSGVTLQNPRCRMVSFHYSWMLCSIMPTYLSNGASTASSGKDFSSSAHQRIPSEQRRH